MLLTAALILTAYAIIGTIVFAMLAAGARANELDEQLRQHRADGDWPHVPTIKAPVHPFAYAEEAQRHHV